MRKFADTAWFSVLQSYHRRQFYRFGGNRRGGFTGYEVDRANPEEFINTLVIQKTPESARLLDTMLMQLPKQKCMPDQENIIEHLQFAIWNNPCPAYESLRKKIKPDIDRMNDETKSWYEHNVVMIPTDSMYKREIGTSKEEIRWW